MKVVSPLGRYRYKLKWFMRAGYLAITVLAWWATIIVFLSGEHDAFWYGILFTFGSTVITLMSINAVLLTSDVVINNEGIGRNFGTYAWQFCRWDDVICCRAWVQLSLQTAQPKYIYNVIRSEDYRIYFLPRGSLTFSEDILSAVRLLGCMNEYIRKWQIQVSISDTRSDGRPVSADRLPSPLSAK